MEIREYLVPLLKWWWLILAAVVVSTGTSLVVTAQPPPQYQAKATLMIGSAIEDPNPTNYQLVAGQQLATTYADIARREPVFRSAAEALGLPRLPRYTARPIPNTNLLEIIVSDDDPARAAVVANELARQLILVSPTSPESEEQQRVSFVNDQLDDLEGKITNTQDEILARQESLASLTSALEIQDMQQQITALQSKLTTLQSNYASLLANSRTNAINTLRIIEPALPPGPNNPPVPVGPNLAVMAAAAAGIGFLLAASAAYLMENLDNTVKSPDEVVRLTTLPLLAGIPSGKGETRNDRSEDAPQKLVTLEQPRSPISEAYRRLRTGIQFAAIDRPDHCSLLVTSTNPGEGKSITASNLAVVIAQAGNRVLLIDADLRRPTQHAVFDLPNNRGLTSLLLKIQTDSRNGEVDAVLNPLVHTTSVENLQVLTSGPIPPNPSELLGSARMRTALQMLSERYDYVLIDSPPVMAVTDAVVLSAIVDSVVVVSEVGTTQRALLRNTVSQLRDVKAHLIGVVLNRLPLRGTDGYMYYQYEHTYADGQGAGTDSRGGILHQIFNRKRKETTAGK